MKPNQDNVFVFWNNPNDIEAKKKYLRWQIEQIELNKQDSFSQIHLKICNQKIAEIEQELKDLGK